MDPAINYSKSYLKQRSKENTDVLKKKLRETLSKSSLIVKDRHIRKASGKHLRKKNVLYKNIDHIKREVIQSGGTITETQVTEKFITFKQKNNHQKDIVKSITTILKKGRTLEQLKKELKPLRKRKKIKHRTKEKIIVYKCYVCQFCEGQARELIASSVSNHFKTQHRSLKYPMRKTEKAILLQIQQIVLNIPEIKN